MTSSPLSVKRGALNTCPTANCVIEFITGTPSTRTQPLALPMRDGALIGVLACMLER